MLGYFEKMRKEPEHKRRKAALFIAAGITLLILIIWIVSLSLRLGGNDWTFRADSGQSGAPSWSQTLSNIGKQWNSITGSSTGQVPGNP